MELDQPQSIALSQNPLVSVIVPNYNHSSFLRERINSILSQTYKNFEIIILDDHSTDDSASVIESFSGNPYVKQIVYNETNSGSPFIQWQKGFGLAQGSFIWIAESDDFCEPDLLQTLVSISNNNPDCVLLFCKSCQVDEKGNKVGEFSMQHGIDSFVLPGRQFIRRHLRDHNIIINASSAIFKKEALGSVEKTFMSFKGCGDWVFWSEIAVQGPVAYCNRYMNYYRVYSNNTTESLKVKGTGVVETYQTVRLFRDKGYYSVPGFFRKVLSLMMDVRYRKNIPEATQQEIFKRCQIGKIYFLITSLFHFLGRK